MPQYIQTKKILKNLVGEKYEIYISPLTLDEFIHAYIRFSKDTRQETIRRLRIMLSRILKLPKLTLVNPPLESKYQLKVITFMKNFNLRARDSYHLLIMKFNKINTFATFDSDFNEVFKKKMLKNAFKI